MNPVSAPQPRNGGSPAAPGGDLYRDRLACWQAIEGRTFATPEAAARYQLRAQRFSAVLDLREADRVPTLLMAAGMIGKYAGITPADGFYNHDKSAAATRAFIEEFDPEYLMMGAAATGPAYDALGYKAYKWPGSTLPDHMPFQYVEGEYMPAADYDALINNPEGYLLRQYLPRVCDQLQGLSLLPSMATPVEMLGVSFWLAGLGAPQVQEALQHLATAATHVRIAMEQAARTSGEFIAQFGTPPLMAGVAKAPFDIVADTLRGTAGALTDLYRRPAKMLAACEALVPAAIHMGIGGARPGGPPFVFMPLHKGATSFMSFRQFEKFYWPTFKQVLEGIIAAGLAPLPFVEGTFDEPRLELIAGSGLPARRTLWLFDRTDMAAVKRIFGGFAGFGGNVPASLFAAGTRAEMDEYCKRLLEIAAPGGGFFLAPGAPIDAAPREVVHAFKRSVAAFGIYRNRD
jgi:uroporphyrinogen-III decarboxylase